MSTLRYAQTTTAVVRQPGDFLARGRAILLPESADDHDRGPVGTAVEVRSFEDLEEGVFVAVGFVGRGWHVFDADFSGA